MVDLIVLIDLTGVTGLVVLIDLTIVIDLVNSLIISDFYNHELVSGLHLYFQKPDCIIFYKC